MGKGRHVLLATMPGMAEGMVTISGFPKTQVMAGSLHTPLHEGLASAVPKARYFLTIARLDNSASHAHFPEISAQGYEGVLGVTSVVRAPTT